MYEKSKTGDFIEVCQDMNIVNTLPEYTKPKNVGLMFFSMELESKEFEKKIFRFVCELGQEIARTMLENIFDNAKSIC